MINLTVLHGVDLSCLSMEDPKGAKGAIVTMANKLTINNSITSVYTYTLLSQQPSIYTYSPPSLVQTNGSRKI
jgi:hypothetical protein